MAESPRIFVVHALAASLAPVAQAFAARWPKAELCNLMDDALSRDRQTGRIREEVFQRRFVDLIRYCLACDASGVLFACSAFNGAIESARRGVPVPVLKPGEALKLGDSFAVVATFEPSIASLRSQIQAEAENYGKAVRVEGIFVEGAMRALSDGDGARHDALIARSVSQLSGVDAVLLAQFSMARAAEAAAPRSPAPLLTSPLSAVARLRSLVVNS